MRSSFFGPVIYFSHCTHLLQSAHLRLRRIVCQCMLSACFWTSRLLLGHQGSLTSVHDLKCIRTKTATLFKVPRGRRGTATRVVHPYPQRHLPSRKSNPGCCRGSPECTIVPAIFHFICYLYCSLLGDF